MDEQHRVYCEDCEHLLGQEGDVPCCAAVPDVEYRRFVRRKWSHANAAPCIRQNMDGKCRLFVGKLPRKPSWWRRLFGSEVLFVEKL